MRQIDLHKLADETRFRGSHLRDQLRIAFPKLRDHRHHLGKARDDVRLDHRRRAKRQQADERAHLQAHRPAIG